MGAVENIIERIRKDAQEKVKKRMAEANKEAQEILNKANIELEKEKKNLELETEKTISIQRSRAVSEAKLEARKVKLSAKEEVISQAFKMANDRLKNLGTLENERYLRNIINNAVSSLGNEVVVLCNSKDAPLVTRISQEINPMASVSSDGINYLGGAIIRTKDGSSQIDATFEGVLERMRNELRKEVADKLFISPSGEQKEV